MNSQRIEKILEKYFHGETSLSEEQTLRGFFRQDELPPHLAELKDQFIMFDKESREVLPEDFDDALFSRINQQKRRAKASKRAVIFYISGVAASILILVTVFFRFDPFTAKSENSTRDAEVAFAEASRILYYVSDKFNQGASPLKKVARFDESINNLNSVKKFDAGVTRATPVSKFKQITDLIINPAP